jgi:hypothetical protein
MRSTTYIQTGLFIGLLLEATTAFAEPATVQLKNGSSIRGELLEYSPGDHVTLALDDGRPLELPATDVRFVAVGAEAQPPSAAQANGVQPETAADDHLPRAASALRLGAALAFGFAGDLSVHLGDDAKDPTDMLATPGFALGFEAPVHRYISIGALVQFGKWNADAIDKDGFGRSTLWDLALFPRVRYPIATSSGLFEIYAGPLLGLSINVLSESIRLEPGTERSTTGLMLGARAGVSYFFSHRIGVNLEFGYQHNDFTFVSREDDSLALSFGQMRVSAGALITL